MTEKEAGCRLSFGDFGRKYVLGVDVDVDENEFWVRKKY